MNMYEAFAELKEDLQTENMIAERKEQIEKIADKLDMNGDKVIVKFDLPDYFEFTVNDDGSENWQIPFMIDDVVVETSATWQGDADGDYDENDCDLEPDHSFESAAEDYYEKTLKALPIKGNGYTIENITIDDIDEESLLPTHARSYSDEDAGIGSYEFWGHTGYDSRPYREIRGDAEYIGKIYGTLFVRVDNLGDHQLS